MPFEQLFELFSEAPLFTTNTANTAYCLLHLVKCVMFYVLYIWCLFTVFTVFTECTKTYHSVTCVRRHPELRRLTVAEAPEAAESRLRVGAYAILCCPIPLLYSTLLYSTLFYSTLLYSTLLYSTLLYSARGRLRVRARHWLNGYFAQRAPSLFPAGSFRSCLNYAVLKCMLPWRARHPLS